MKIIIGFSFGSRNGWPNKSTQAIAELIAVFVQGRRYDYTLIAQWEVAKALELYHVTCDHVVWSRPTGHGYLRTTDVVDSAIKFMVDNDLDEASEVYAAAHPDHVDRCIADLRCGWLPRAKPITKVNMAYDPQSNQIWVRARWRFLVWNFLATLATRSISGEL